MNRIPEGTQVGSIGGDLEFKLCPSWSEVFLPGGLEFPVFCVPGSLSTGDRCQGGDKVCAC